MAPLLHRAAITRQSKIADFANALFDSTDAYGEVYGRGMSVSGRQRREL